MFAAVRVPPTPSAFVRYKAWRYDDTVEMVAPCPCGYPNAEWTGKRSDALDTEWVTIDCPRCF